MYRTLHIDTRINITAKTLVTSIDVPGVLALAATGMQTIDGITRFYYAGQPPLRLLVVTRTGGSIAEIPTGAYVQALVGWDNGESPYTLATNANRQHTKITIDGVLGVLQADEPVIPLSALIAKAPRSDQRGGSRPHAGRPAGPDPVPSVVRPVGRPPLGLGPTRRYTVTLPAAIADWLIELGDGNLSAGVREAARKAGFGTVEQ